MAKKTNKIDLNKYREYSSIFSSSSFNDLIKNDNYSFLDARIKQYDQSKVDSVTTYYDYIRFVYKELGKNYRNEYIYKNTIINDLIIKKYGVKDSLVINEFRVGNSIADIVLFNGNSKVFEIKTELDSSKRLESQLSDYSKVFNQCYIVTHKSLIDKYLKTNESVGIIEFNESGRSLKLNEIRPAIENLKIDPETVINCVRTNEYKSIVKQYYGSLPEMNSFNMFNICRDLIGKIPNDNLNSLFITQLKKRRSNTKSIKYFKKELRQIGVALNFDLATYNELFLKLNKPISI